MRGRFDFGLSCSATETTEHRPHHEVDQSDDRHRDEQYQQEQDKEHDRHGRGNAEQGRPNLLDP